MTDLNQRMKELDDLRPPNLWQSIHERSSRPQTFIQRVLSYFRFISAMQVAALAVALAAIVGLGVVVSNFESEEVSTASDPSDIGDEDESTGGADVGQTTNEDSVGSGGRPSSGTATGAQGSSRDEPRTEENAPGGTSSRDNETAGPPIHYTDQADDAYGQGGGPPNAELNQREFDILRVDWGPVSYVNEQSPGGYFTSITIAGSARSDGEYISEGQFDPARTPPEGCWLSHFLTPGTTGRANAYCQGRFVGYVKGGPVTSTPTPSGGTRLAATFDSRTIPPEFEAARNLHNLAAYTCPPSSCEGQFLVGRWVDYASSDLTYRV